MAKRSPVGILLAAIVWLVIIAAGAVAYKFFLHPKLQGKLERMTGSESQYRHEVRLALDSFSGYSVLRSDTFRGRLKTQGIKYTVIDDEADYVGRMESLRDGDLDLAVFTVDSMITAAAAAGRFPATIILILDETKGADAIVAYQNGVASIKDLDDPSARFVATPNSPSEFLARIAVANFSLPRLSEDWLVGGDGAEDVYNRFRAASPNEKRAYVLWEPYVSKALEEPGAHVLLDSSKLQGYILDVLVAHRDFLRREPDLVRTFVEEYLRSAFAYQEKDAMVRLVMDDARALGLRDIKRPQAEKLVEGIEWKNTLENYAHFGLLAEGESKGLTHLEDVILQITDVLMRTGALARDPLEGQASTLFYNKVLGDLKASSFHPGREVNILSGAGLDTGAFETVRGASELLPLSKEEWARLVTVAEMRVPPLSFARGTARLNIEGSRNLSRLAQQLKSFPDYYLTVIGHSRAEGDTEANVRLAGERAEAAAEFLRREGLGEDRIRADAAQPSRDGGEAQSVSFVVAQRPY